MRNKGQLIIVVAALVLFAPSCNSCNGRSNGDRGGGSVSESPSNKNEGGLEVSVKLGRDEAIEKVRTFLNRRGGIVTVKLPYTDYETVRKPCTQYDVDTDPNKNDEFLARCKPVGGAPGAPYGSKTVQEPRSKCCRPKSVQWTSLKPTWTAEYSRDTDNWSVHMEFEVEHVKKALGWIVNDKSGEVKENQ